MCVGEHVKLVDFGVATLIGSERTIAGTVEFMAPEVLIGKAPTPASDLYSLGVVACELLSGAYPFDRSSAPRFLSSVLDPEEYPTTAEQQRVLAVLCQHMPQSEEVQRQLSPAETATAALEHIEPPALRSVVRRLMARRPAERFGAAEEVLAALGEATGVSYAAAMGETRESFLKSARLVGRDRELAALEAALDEARRGRGEAWLIGGESGVGKSRLLDELRAMALVRGVQVVRGQTQSSGQSYKEWGDVLKPLCLSTQLSELAASVLKPIVPGLPELLGRHIDDAPEVDPTTTQQRLINTALDVLLAQSSPTLIILEDAHWSSPESVVLLRRLVGQLGQGSGRPLLIVASYRDDERLDLPAQLPGIRQLRLEQLESAQIAELSASMLGEAGRQDELLTLLARESEGNTFFMIEVVRALAEEAGSLEVVGRGSRPPVLKSGGIQAVLDRRLRRVPAEWRQLLLLTAVVGRQVDLPLLHVLHSEPERFLRQCADAAVLEPVEKEWRFSHDKLREAAIASLSPSERRQLHGQVAAALLKAYPDPNNQAARLALHYEESGNAPEAARYAALAGEQAWRAGAMRESKTQLLRALAYLDQESAPESAFERAHLRRILAGCYLVLGQLNDVVETGVRAFELLGLEFPRQRSQLRRQIARHALEFVGALYGIVKTPRARQADEARLQEIIEVAWILGRTLNWLQRGEESLLTCLISEQAARRLHSVDGQLVSLSTMGVILLLLGQRRMADRCIEQLTPLIPQGSAQSRIPRLSATLMFDLLDCEWHELRSRTEELRAESRRQGDPASECFASYIETGLHTLAGRLDRVEATIAVIRRLALRNESAQFTIMAATLDSLLALYRGELAQTIGLCQVTIASAQASGDKIAEVSAMGLLMLAHFHAGELPEALALADNLQDRLDDAFTNNSTLLDTSSAPTEMFLTLWQRQDSSVPQLQQRALRAVAQLRRSAEICRLNRPRFLLWSGVLAGLRGQRRRQLALLEQSRREAHQQSLRIEEGRACMELGRILGAADPAGSAHLRRARELFAETGASLLSQRLQSLFA